MCALNRLRSGGTTRSQTRTSARQICLANNEATVTEYLRKVSF